MTTGFEAMWAEREKAHDCEIAQLQRQETRTSPSTHT